MKGFPTQSSFQPRSNLNESILFASGVNIGPTTIPRGVPGSAKQIGKVIEAGKKFKLEGIQIFCDRACMIAVRVYKTATALNFANVYEQFLFPLGEKQTSVLLPYNEMLYEGGGVTVIATPMASSSTSDSEPQVAFRLAGQALSSFELENPDYSILVLGDSKPLYSMDNGEYGERYYCYHLTQYLLDNGKKTSCIDRTMPSATSSDMVKLLKSGALNGVNYDLLVVAIGTNDAQFAASTANLATYRTNLIECINYRNRYCPTSSIVFNTPGVTDRSDRLSNIDGYRSTLNQVVSDYSGTRVYACQEHEAFVVSTTGKDNRFKVSEAQGSQLHYSGLGQDEVYTNKFLPAVKTTYFYTNVLKLS